MRFGFAIVVIFSNAGFIRSVATTAFDDLIIPYTVNIVCTTNNDLTNYLMQTHCQFIVIRRFQILITRQSFIT